MTPDEIEHLFSSHLLRGNTAEEREEGTALPEAEKLRRVESLSQVLTAVRHLWETGSRDLDAIAEKIGNGVRDGSWRIPLGESQLLHFFIEIIGTNGLRKPLLVHALRIIGNSCADTNQNRQQVVAADCLLNIVKLLRDDSILPLVVPVLFNICVDYEPAQVAVYKAGLNPELISLLSGPRLPNADGFMSIIFKLLRLVASQEPEADLAHPDTPYTLLGLAAAAGSERLPPADDPEDFLGQVSVALTYLAHTQFQDSFLAQPNAVPLFLSACSRACAGFSAEQADPEELAQLKQTQSVFMQVLADLSAHPAFAAACPLDGPEVETLRVWIAACSSSSTPSHAQQLRGAAACLALGNVARSDAACVLLVEAAEVHEPLIAMVSEESNTNAQLLHAALGFLRNLAIPAANKAVLGGAGLLDGDAPALPRLWQIGAQPQVQFAAVSFARLLLVNCVENVRRVCAVARRGDDQAAAAAATHLQILLDVFRETDQEPTKMETARAVLGVCRTLHTDTTSVLPPATSKGSGSRSGSNDNLQLEEFYGGHAQIPNALLFLCLQKKYPLLRSELWFVLALMARSAAGAKVVAGLTQHREFLETLSGAVTGRNILGGEESGTDCIADDPIVPPRPDATGSSVGTSIGGLGLEPQHVDSKQAASVTKVDRENGLVLINGLMDRKSDDWNTFPLDALRRILKEGSDLIIASKIED